MKYLITDSNDSRYNLAFEEYCFNKLPMDDSYLFFWINSPTIVIGKNQNTLEEVNHDYVKEKDIKVVRRTTGGGAVYHDLGNVNFSIITSAEDSSSIDFKKYNIPIVNALKELGIDCELSGRNDMTIGGDKFSGIAQSIAGNRVLNHGTLLFNSKLDTLSKALIPKKDKLESKGIKSIRARVTNISDHLEDSISIEEFKRVLMEKLFEMDKSPLVEYVLSTEDLRQIEKLRDEKYDTWDWNYGYSPKCSYKNYKRFPFGSVQISFNIIDGKIQDTTIFGDFFGSRDISILCDHLNGSKYREEDLQTILSKEPLDEYFGNVSSDEILNLIMDI